MIIDTEPQSYITLLLNVCYNVRKGILLVEGCLKN